MKVICVLSLVESKRESENSKILIREFARLLGANFTPLKTFTMNRGSRECTFLWYIEHYSHCCYKSGEPLVSPEFHADEEESKGWTLNLYPRGLTKKTEDIICIGLTKGKNVITCDNAPFAYELSIIAEDGSFLPLKQNNDLSQKYNGWIFFQKDKVLLNRNPDYRPNDTLTVSCKIQIGEGVVQKVGRTSARTQIGVERISFLHTVENYRKLETNQRETFQIRSLSKKDRVITCSVYISDGFCCKQKMIIEIATSNPHNVLTTCEISLLDATGEITKCVEVDNRFDSTVNDTTKISMGAFTKDIIGERGDSDDDKLSILFECTLSTGVEFERIVETVFEMPLETMEIINDGDTKDPYKCPTALDDLKAIYEDKFLTDVELRTKTKSFPAHKIVLCARSPVFKAVMNNDMKEKNTECIEIDDLDDDIMQQLLLFLYSDDIEDLQWETACKLYYASDKYGIEKLKVICSDYLDDNLSISNAIELLLLADTHNDSDLKENVEDFILGNDEKVFGLDEWRQLMKENPQLAAETMHLKYIKKRLITAALKITVLYDEYLSGEA